VQHAQSPQFVEALENSDKRAKRATEYPEQNCRIERESHGQSLMFDKLADQRMTPTLLVLNEFCDWARCHLEFGITIPSTPFHRASKHVSTHSLGFTCVVIDGRTSCGDEETEPEIRWSAKGRGYWNPWRSPAATNRLAVVGSR
jgi:hypothetical protein